MDQYSSDRFAAAGTPAPKDDEPSREEVQQRISSLYDRVENAGGNFNATRAATAATRTVKPASGNGGGRGGATDAAAPLPEVAKRWFDVGRSQLGPVVPAMLPPDRMPDRRPDRGSAGSRPADSGARPGGRDETAGKPVLELTAGPSAGGAAGPVAELTARPVAELTAGPVAALPAVPAQRQASGRTAALPGPAADPSQTSQASLRTSKQRNQRKLGQARELLAGHAARRSAPVAAIESSRPVENAWRPAEEQTYPWAAADPWQQQSTGYGTEPYTGSAPYAGTDMRAGTDQYAGTAAYPGTATYPGPGMGAATDQSIGGGMYLGTDQYAGTGLYADASTPIAAGIVRDMQGTPAPAYATPAPAYAAPDPGYAAPGPGYAAPDPGYAGKAARAVDFARGQIGKPCVWGAMGPGSYDCSSLTQAAWRAAGVALPRAVHEQATAGTMIPVSDIRLGDLILFSGPVGHVGICTGNGMMIHAPSPGVAIREESIYWAGESAIHSVIRPV
ncbi:NlpC/P60 family protein [Streptomyces aurantiacus]|uniref:C40 family peptidase n=1 Tax=Streptomyces aurantiacus TaxID=47760 RepID=UPI0006E283E6|nr:NlpC/P60 family protein [Streptomyces aurantiacus]